MQKTHGALTHDNLKTCNQKPQRSLVQRIGLGALAAFSIYMLYMAWVLHYPMLQGIVLDRLTGIPILSAQVYKAAQGSVFPSEKAVLGMGGEDNVTVPANGVFSFRGGLGLSWGLLWPFQNVDRVAIWVYAKDYIPLELSEPDSVSRESLEGGAYWHSFKKDGDWEIFPSTSGTVKRRRLLGRGWTYRIEMVKAVTKEQWVEKCNRTLAFSSDFPSGRYTQCPEDQWVFQDLVGYLDKWPEDEAAPHYMAALLQTGYVASCDYLNKQLISGEISSGTLLLLYKRNQEILRLAEHVPRQTDLVAAKVQDRSLQSMRGLMPCMRAHLTEQVLRERE
jgi:hypothetical protein